MSTSTRLNDARAKSPSKRTVADWTLIVEDAKRDLSHTDAVLYALTMPKGKPRREWEARMGAPVVVELHAWEGHDPTTNYRATVYRPLGACPVVMVQYFIVGAATGGYNVECHDFETWVEGRHDTSLPLAWRILKERAWLAWRAVAGPRDSTATIAPKGA